MAVKTGVSMISIAITKEMRYSIFLCLYIFLYIKKHKKEVNVIVAYTFQSVFPLGIYILFIFLKIIIDITLFITDNINGITNVTIALSQ